MKKIIVNEDDGSISFEEIVQIIIGADRSMTESEKAWTFYISKKFYSFPKSQCDMKETKEGYNLLVPEWLMKKHPLDKLEGNCNVKIL